MSENQEVAVDQMRRAVHKLGSSAEDYGVITLIRFLVARSFYIDKAAKMFVQWRNWRTWFVPLNHIPDSEFAGELQQNIIFLLGLSPRGNPDVAVKVHGHVPSKDQLQIVIVSGEEERRALIREVCVETLPEELGGQARFTLLLDFQLDNKPLKEKLC